MPSKRPQKPKTTPQIAVIKVSTEREYPKLPIYFLTAIQKLQFHKFIIVKSRKREIILMEHISKSDIILSEIMRSIERINGNMAIVQTDVAILKER